MGKVASFYLFSKERESSCDLRGSISFDKKLFDENGLDAEYLLQSKELFSLKFWSDQEGCKHQITASASHKPPSSNILIFLYVIVNLIIYALNLYGSQNIIEKIKEDSNNACRYSLLIVETAVTQDFFLIVFNLMLSSMIGSKNFFFFIFFLYATLFAIWDNRVLVLIWKFQLHRREVTSQQFKTLIFCYQMKIYLFIILYTVLMWKFFLQPWLLLANAFILFPQIFHNIFSQISPEIDLSFLLCFSALKFVALFLLRGFNFGFIEIKTFPLHFFAGLFILSLQICFIYIQHNYGSKFFLPAFFCQGNSASFLSLKDYLKYLKNQDKSKETQDSENQSFIDDQSCPICLNPLTKFIDFDDSVSSQINNNFYKRLCKRNSGDKIIVTPCGHAFHPVCLLKWSEIRVECPCCRSGLTFE